MALSQQEKNFLNILESLQEKLSWQKSSINHPIGFYHSLFNRNSKDGYYLKHQVVEAYAVTSDTILQITMRLEIQCNHDTINPDLTANHCFILKVRDLKGRYGKKVPIDIMSTVGEESYEFLKKIFFAINEKAEERGKFDIIRGDKMIGDINVQLSEHYA